MKLKNQGREALFCIITMIVTAFFMMPSHTVTVDKHIIDKETFYIVDLGSDGKWITKQVNYKILNCQTWVNTETGKSCHKAQTGVPFIVDSSELNNHVFAYWDSEKNKQLKAIARKIDD